MKLSEFNDVKKDYKQVKYIHGVSEPITEADVIKFTLGGTRFVGAIRYIQEKGCSTWTDRGHYAPAWENITHVFKKKEQKRIKIKRLATRLATDSPIPLLDEALDKILSKVDTSLLTVKEEKVINSNIYKRIITVRKGRGRKFIQLAIEDKTQSAIIVTGTDIRKWTLKPNGKGKITSSQTCNAVSKINTLLED